MSEKLLELRNISKSYTKSNKILKDLDLVIEREEIFFLLGPSGCGKSTLLRVIAGLIKEDCGELYLEGNSIKHCAVEKRLMAMVFQNYALWPHLNVFENIAFGLKAKKLKSAEIKSKVDELLDIIQMKEFSSRMITSLSGGQQQRIALARALAVEPKLLLLDEPLSNLDSKLRETMRSEIRRIIKKNNLSAIYVTHDRNEALAIADRIAIMNLGVVVQVGTSKELYNYPKSYFVANFLGKVNKLSGKVVELKKDNILVVENEFGKFKVNNYHQFKYEVGDNINAIIRYENVKLNSKDNEKNVVTGKLIDNAFMGDHSECFFELMSGEIFEVFISPAVDLEVGSNYKLELPKENLIVVEDL